MTPPEPSGAGTGNPPSRPTSIKAVKNGPLQVKGSFVLKDPSGQDYDLDGAPVTLLCRCGQSTNQPFCDSSHTRAGFVSADVPAQGSDDGAG